MKPTPRDAIEAALKALKFVQDTYNIGCSGAITDLEDVLQLLPYNDELNTWERLRSLNILLDKTLAEEEAAEEEAAEEEAAEEPCNMGSLCVGCALRNDDGSCPSESPPTVAQPVAPKEYTQPAEPVKTISLHAGVLAYLEKLHFFS